MEDSAYKSSSQYRLFTYTADQLSDLRKQTNRSAAERLREETRRAVASGDALPVTAVATPNESASDAGSTNGNGGNSNAADRSAQELDCLTAEEELKLVAWYCISCLQLAEHYGFPSNVKATALVYLHRLYLTTSPMALHPKKLLLPVLYLATKTENNYISIKQFIDKAAEAGLKTTKEDLLAPEITIAMGLRWSFQVWHPLRGLEGIFLELNVIDSGLYAPPRSEESLDPKLLQARIKALANGGNRITRAHGEARKLLTGTVLLTDVYFLYTPPQICFAATWAADKELAEFYVDVKLPSEAQTKAKEKLLDIIRECAEYHLLGTKNIERPGLLLNTTHNGIATSVTAVTDVVKKEATRIDKKLYHLTKPLKKPANKREQQSTEDEERKNKKRKLEKEKNEMDGAVFGSALEEVK